MESSLQDVYLNFIHLPFFFWWILTLCFLSLCYTHLCSMTSVPLSISFLGQYPDAAVIPHEIWHKPREVRKKQKTKIYGSSLRFGLTIPVVLQDFLFQLPKCLSFPPLLPHPPLLLFFLDLFILSPSFLIISLPFLFPPSAPMPFISPQPSRSFPVQFYPSLF